MLAISVVLLSTAVLASLWFALAEESGANYERNNAIVCLTPAAVDVAAAFVIFEDFVF